MKRRILLYFSIFFLVCSGSYAFPDENLDLENDMAGEYEEEYAEDYEESSEEDYEAELKKEKIEEKVKWGLALSDLQNFPEAVKTFEEVLELDPENITANLLAGVLKPLTRLEGIAPRIKNILSEKDHSSLVEWIKEGRDEAPKELVVAGYFFMKYLLTETKSDGTSVSVWESVSDIQDALTSGLLSVLDESIERLNIVLNQEGDITAIINIAHVFGIPHKAVTEMDDDYLKEDKIVNKAEVALVKAVFQALNFVGYATSAYELDILKNLKKELDDPMEIMAALQMEENAAALTLRDNGVLYLQKAGKSFVGAINSLDQVIDYAVVEALDSDIDQDGHLLPVEWIYESAPKAKKSLAKLKKVLTKEYEVTNSKTGVHITTLNVPALFDGSNADLKKLLPTGFSEDGMIIFSDKTMGGVFPEGDFPEATEKIDQDEEIKFIIEALTGFMMNSW